MKHRSSKKGPNRSLAADHARPVTIADIAAPGLLEKELSKFEHFLYRAIDRQSFELGRCGMNAWKRAAGAGAAISKCITSINHSINKL